MRYSHTQSSPMHWVIGAVAVGMGVTAALVPSTVVATIVGIAAAFTLVLAFSFATLTVEVDEADLVVRYGPLPFFRTRFALDRIESVERSRSTILDGWGIHWVPGRGWTYNLWGFDCVRLGVTGGRTIRIGTDDPDGLFAALSHETDPERQAA